MISYSVTWRAKLNFNTGGPMKAILALAFIGLTASLASAEEIATCRSPSGKAFFHFDGLLSKGDSGWADDKISAGVTTLNQNADGSLDILYVDIRNKPISTVQEGGVVRLLRRTANTAVLVVLYPDSTEIYTFFRERDGKNRFSLLTARSGNVPISKSSVLVGDCNEIRFGMLK